MGTLRHSTRVEEVRLYLREEAEDDVKCVLAAVGELPQLQKLVLGGQAFSDHIKALAEAVLKHGRLRELMLDNTPVGNDGAEHLAAMLEWNCSLKVLNVDDCLIGDAGLERLGRTLTGNTTLKKLEL